MSSYIAGKDNMKGQGMCWRNRENIIVSYEKLNYQFEEIRISQDLESAWPICKNN